MRFHNINKLRFCVVYNNQPNALQLALAYNYSVCIFMPFSLRTSATPQTLCVNCNVKSPSVPERILTPEFIIFFPLMLPMSVYQRCIAIVCVCVCIVSQSTRSNLGSPLNIVYNYAGVNIRVSFSEIKNNKGECGFVISVC